MLEGADFVPERRAAAEPFCIVARVVTCFPHCGVFALVFNNDNYYLMSYDPTTDNEVRNYRVDRMDSVQHLDKCICKAAAEKIQTVSKYTEQVFRMYGGRTELVTLQFEKKLIGSIYDKFGEKTNISKCGDEYFVAVEVQISPTFWSWLITFKGQMKLTAPDSVIAEYKEWLKDI